MSGTWRRSPRERLVHHVQQLERLEEEKKAAADALRYAFREAKIAGFDPATLKVVLRLRKMTREQRSERRALEAIYMAALGMLEGEPLPDEARRRLDEREQKPPEDPDVDAGEDDDNTNGNGDGRSDDDGSASPRPTPEPLLPFKDPEEARQEGRDAATAGKRIYDNPFPAGDACRAAWDEGWCAQSKSHGMDTPHAYQRRKPPERPPGNDAGDGDRPEAR